MTIGTLLVLIGFILALVAMFADRVGRYGGYILPFAVALVALGILLGVEPFIEV